MKILFFTQAIMFVEWQNMIVHWNRRNVEGLKDLKTIFNFHVVIPANFTLVIAEAKSTANVAKDATLLVSIKQCSTFPFQL